MGLQTTTIMAVIGMALLFILILVLEVMSTPTMKERKDGTEYIPPLTKRQQQYQFSSKMCFYGMIEMIFTILISALESCQ